MGSGASSPDGEKQRELDSVDRRRSDAAIAALDDMFGSTAAMDGEARMEELEKERLASAKLDEEMAKKRAEAERKVKVLVLGTGESGKSTTFKQMRLMYGQVSRDQLVGYRQVVHGNVMASIHARIEQAGDDAVACKDALAFVKDNTEEDTEMTPEIGEHVKALWADAAIQSAWDERHATKIEIVESFAYFAQHLERICAPEYMDESANFTSEQLKDMKADVINAYGRTSGVLTAVYEVDDHEFEFIDVGGQRSERKKW